MATSQTKPYRITAEGIPLKHEQSEKIYKTFFAVSDYYKKHPNPGACHLISSIFHILLNEQKVENDLCIGEVKTGFQYFDHSWIEIDGKVFDIAIQLTLDGTRNAPIYAGYDLQTEVKSDRTYGSLSPTGFDRDANQVLRTPFVKYMDRYPHFKEGAWKIVKVVGRELRLKLDIAELRQRYKNTERTLKTSPS
ncbi:MULTISPECIES: lasso peptide biosynthesis protein [Bacillaceae]|uniref:Lasso peptide biosynthesis protein n=1 Tax=Gracilibacillus salinarum TaxID=2932255 RepID=A0ABY4GKC1_9BACI|nr:MULTISPECIES: lasso peptide biosynthesis protein [Bacillaceae]UOQ84644.1 lasso peptide biosynthesis protein [Gracilibacillus salinarum]